MKNIRILSLILVAVLMLSVFAGCGAKIPEITVTVKVVDADKEVIAERAVIFSDENPTAILALQYLCEAEELDCVIDDSGTEVKKIGKVEARVDEKNNLRYYWSSKHNGKDARAAYTVVADGDTVEFFMASMDNTPTEIKDPDAQSEE